MGTHFLDRLFTPHSIAVFGASKRPESVGARGFDNLHNDGFTGQTYPINPKDKQLNDQTCYPSIEAFGKPVDLVVIAVLEKAGEDTELGVSRYVMNPDGESCEFALVLADEWQHRSIGRN